MTLPVEPIFIQIAKRRYQVESLEQASAMFCKARDASGFGASDICEPLVVTAEGKPVARISYNGIVWPPGEWFPGMEPIYNNCAPLQFVPAAVPQPAPKRIRAKRRRA